MSQKSYKILTEQGILSVLEQKYSDQPEKLDLIRRFGNFFTYFTGFNQNRENYYSTEEKSTAVAYRTINQNLLTFANNCELFEALQVLDLSAQEQKVFTPDSYSDYLVQEGIQHYNEQIASIKSKINLYIQQHKTKLPQPKELYKQIGAPVTKQVPFDLINNDEEFLAVMEQFIEQTNVKLPLMEQLFMQLSSGIFDLNQLFFSKSALNQLSNRYFANRHLLLEKGVELKLFKYQKNAEESYKLPAYVSLAQLKVLLESLPATWIQEGQTIGLFKMQRAQE